MNRDVAIDVRQLTLSYGSNLIQSDLNFQVRRGDVFVIMGGSGCGKSTLLKHMVGLYQPAAGEILFDGHSYFTASSAQQSAMRQRWGVTYQGERCSAIRRWQKMSPCRWRSTPR